MSAFKEISKIAGAFVGVIVGAGFASGQEILQFFTSFGVHGLIGCVVAGLTFVFLSMVFRPGPAPAGAVAQGSRPGPGRHLGMVFDLLITFFLFAITVVMLAGTGSLLQQWLGLPEAWGSVLATIATVLIVCLDVRQVIAFIGAVTPLLVFLTVVVAAYVVSTRTPATTCCWSPRNSSRAAPASGWWPPSCTCPTTSSPACRSWSSWAARPARAATRCGAASWAACCSAS